MILKIEFENFYSIKDSIRIDFRAANINTALARELKHNIMEWNGVPVLKSVDVNDMMVFDSFNTYKRVILKALEICDTDIGRFHS